MLQCLGSGNSTDINNDINRYQHDISSDISLLSTVISMGYNPYVDRCLQ
jgi:hypothetical protein